MANVLIACEFSGIVREAFRKQGHNAWSCDILHSEIEGQHIQANILDVLYNDEVSFYGVPKRWDLMIAHPPCTFLTKAGTRWLFPKGELNKQRYNKGLEAKDFFLKLLNFDCSRIAIENPVPQKVFNMPTPTQIIQPYEYKHKLKKTTCLWLKNLPELKPSNIVKPEFYIDRKGIRHTKLTGWSKKRKSRTFPGIAEAMAKQWGKLLPLAQQLKGGTEKAKLSGTPKGGNGIKPKER